MSESGHDGAPTERTVPRGRVSPPPLADSILGAIGNTPLVALDLQGVQHVFALVAAQLLVDEHLPARGRLQAGDITEEC